MRSTQLDNESNEPTDIERVRFTSLARTLIRPLARSLSIVALPQQTHTELAAQATQKKQPPNFLSPLGRLMDIYIYIYLYSYI